MRGNESSPPVAERFRRTQRVVLDLREPPTREEAGLVDGEATLIVERDPGGMLDVSFSLPNDEVLAVPAIGVVLTTAPGGEPDGPVESITVNRAAGDLAEARAALLADADVLELDAAEIDRYFAGVSRGDRVRRVFQARPVGYIRVDVEVRHDPANGAHADIDYKLDWGSAVS